MVFRPGSCDDKHTVGFLKIKCKKSKIIKNIYSKHSKIIPFKKGFGLLGSALQKETKKNPKN
jgi:hypothetical protein